MDRKDIVRIMTETGFSPDEYWIQAGAAMVMHGLREQTHDIDIGCTTALIERLKAAGCPGEPMTDGHIKYAVSELIEASENWARGTVTLIDGVPVVSLADVLSLKLSLNREKDQKDILRLKAALGLSETARV